SRVVDDGDGNGTIREAFAYGGECGVVAADDRPGQASALAAFHNQQLIVPVTTHPVRAREGAIQPQFHDIDGLAIVADSNGEQLVGGQSVHEHPVVQDSNAIEHAAAGAEG